MTVAGRSTVAPARSSGNSFCIKKKGDLRLRSITSSQFSSLKLSSGASVRVPALLTRMWSDFSRPLISATNAAIPPRVETSAESPTTLHSEPTSFKELAPDEVIRSASGELQQSLGVELLAKILASPPDFFERLVVQLLVAMGYGGSAIEAGKALGKSGDGGVDGVIDQDALGLDRIYVQAKRYTDSKVSSGEIRDFFGSLDRFKANKGLFVTTSTFSHAAKETADMLSKRIVLIDGLLLTRLMIRFDIGCRVEEVVYIKKLDEDFFD